jgi:high-affinity iron transporter
VLAALIIVFREVFEAGLIVGIVMAVMRAVANRGWWVSAGVLGGVLGACVVAAFAGTLSATFGGSGQELFNAPSRKTATPTTMSYSFMVSPPQREAPV